jgi:hypothetical protein
MCMGDVMLNLPPFFRSGNNELTLVRTPVRRLVRSPVLTEFEQGLVFKKGN